MILKTYGTSLIASGYWMASISGYNAQVLVAHYTITIKNILAFIVLLPIFNRKYCFTLFNLGKYGSNNDS